MRKTSLCRKVLFCPKETNERDTALREKSDGWNGIGETEHRRGLAGENDFTIVGASNKGTFQKSIDSSVGTLPTFPNILATTSAASEGAKMCGIWMAVAWDH